MKIEDLPDEILIKILRYLTKEAVINEISKVSKRFYQLSMDKSIKLDLTFSYWIDAQQAINMLDNRGYQIRNLNILYPRPIVRTIIYKKMDLLLKLENLEIDEFQIISDKTLMNIVQKDKLKILTIQTTIMNSLMTEAVHFKSLLSLRLDYSDMGFEDLKKLVHLEKLENLTIGKLRFEPSDQHIEEIGQVSNLTKLQFINQEEIQPAFFKLMAKCFPKLFIFEIQGGRHTKINTDEQFQSLEHFLERTKCSCYLNFPINIQINEGQKIFESFHFRMEHRFTVILAYPVSKFIVDYFYTSGLRRIHF